MTVNVEDERRRIEAEVVTRVLAATPSFTAVPEPGVPVNVRGRVLTCKACELRGQLPEGCRPLPPTPATTGPTGTRWGVMLDSPQMDAHEDPALIGRAERFLKICMEAAGIDPDTIGWGHTVQCATGEEGLPTRRHPAQHEIDRCRPLVDGWLGGMDAVLLAGRSALGQWRPDLTIENTRGLIGMWEREDGTRRVVGVVRHPDSVLKSGAKNEQRAELIVDLKRWVEVLDLRGTTGEDEVGGWIVDRMGVACPECRHSANEGIADRVKWIDPDGIGWCQTHMVGTKIKPAGLTRWQDARKGWGRIVQEGMF